MNHATWVLLALSGLGTGCVAPRDGQFLCSTVAPECPDGWTCRADGRCYATAAGMDSGAPDASRVDASRVDAARRDGDVLPERDAGAGPDATALDAAGIDASALDAAGSDASESKDSGTDAGATAECSSPAQCDDANPCTDDTCVDSRCVRTNNSIACSDGIFCNGVDTCGGGTCSVHAGDVCPGPCVSEACVDCGSFGEPCCDGATCNGLRMCLGGTVCGCRRGDCGDTGACEAGVCGPCGTTGMLCCDDGACETGFCLGRECM